MDLTLLAAAQEQTHDLPADPFVIGAGTFVFLLMMMAALLMFGKGRPHS